MRCGQISMIPSAARSRTMSSKWRAWVARLSSRRQRAPKRSASRSSPPVGAATIQLAPCSAASGGSGAGQGTPSLSMRPRLVWSIFRTRPPEWMIKRPPPVASDVVSGELFRSPSKRDQSSVVHPSKRTSLVNIFDGNRSTTSPVPRGSRSRSAISAGRPLKYRRGRRHICRSSDRPRRRRQSAFFGRCSACSVRFLRASRATPMQRSGSESLAK